MIKITYNFTRKLLLLLSIATGALFLAQPSTPPGGGVGGTTPGVASPIDDYIFLLLPIAVLLVIYFAVKYRKQLN